MWYLCQSPKQLVLLMCSRLYVWPYKIYTSVTRRMGFRPPAPKAILQKKNCKPIAFLGGVPIFTPMFTIILLKLVKPILPPIFTIF